jgi:phosphoenolpyruvate-protein kinase (PTS system EI component)
MTSTPQEPSAFQTTSTGTTEEAGQEGDTGGPGSHAAIVARECGIPGVMGTGTATSVLVDGQRVIVDGDLGVVRAAAE